MKRGFLNKTVLFVLLGLLVWGGCDTPTNGTDDFTAVTGISGVPSSGTAGTPLALTGTVEPENATNKTIVWSVKTQGTTATGAAVEGSTLTAAGAGTVVVTAVIAKGAAKDADWTKDFIITITDSGSSFTAVTGISGVPSSGTAGTRLALTGTVEPENATNKTIVWSVKAVGTTAEGAAIEGGALTVTDAGTVVVTATIANGAAEGTDWTGDFSITFSRPAYNMISINGGEVSDATTGSGSTANWAAGEIAAYNKPYTMAAFTIGETEVTYELWKAVYDWSTADARGDSKYIYRLPGTMGGKFGAAVAPESATLRHPVTAITWRDAVTWCNAYSEYLGKTPVYYKFGTIDFSDTSKVIRESYWRTGANGVAAGNGEQENAVLNPNATGFRLPTEAEWEYAARGGVPGTSAPWTNEFSGTNEEAQLGDYAWYGDSASDAPTHPVKTKQPNSAGLYDMSGNVWEYVWDIYSGIGTSQQRGYRGGYFRGSASNAKVSYRGYMNTAPQSNIAYGDVFTGFRIVSK